MNNAELNAVVDRIGVAARTLNEAAEAATRIIESLDARLVDADPGVSIWGAVLVNEKTTHQRDEGASGEPAQRVVTLGFSKVKKKKWGLCVREEIKGKKGVSLEEELTLLRKADRTLRLAALPHLEALTSALLGELETAAAGAVELLQPVAAEAVDDSVVPAASEPDAVYAASH